MDSSPFVQLPGEIRNTIYEHCLQLPTPVIVSLTQDEPRLRDIPHPNMLALTRTCKQIRMESTSVFFQMHSFQLVFRVMELDPFDADMWQKRLLTWLKMIGDHGRKYLSQVYLDIGVSTLYRPPVSCESVWRTIYSFLKHFNTDRTSVSLATIVRWAWRGEHEFLLWLPMHDLTKARSAVDQAMEDEWLLLDEYCRSRKVDASDVGYRRMELATCGQELRNFVGLIETTPV